MASVDRGRIVKAAEATLSLAADLHHGVSGGGKSRRAERFLLQRRLLLARSEQARRPAVPSRDGESYPGDFNRHRMAMRNLRDAVAALGAAYKITGDDRYARKAAELLRGFFIDPKTRMNPNFDFAQVAPGHGGGRSYGIIDGLHFIEIPLAIAALQKSPAFTPELTAGLKRWFADMSHWMITSKNGKQEAAAKNDHAVAYWLQIALLRAT